MAMSYNKAKRGAELRAKLIALLNANVDMSIEHMAQKLEEKPHAIYHQLHYNMIPNKQVVPKRKGITTVYNRSEIVPVNEPEDVLFEEQFKIPEPTVSPAPKVPDIALEMIESTGHLRVTLGDLVIDISKRQ